MHRTSAWFAVLVLANIAVSTVSDSRTAVAQVSEPLDQTRTLRLRGELNEAQAVAERELGLASVSPKQEVQFRLELAKIHDRVGLHQNTRPVPEALEQIEAAARAADRAGPQGVAQVELARAEYHYRAEMAQREFPTATASANRAIRMFQDLDDKHGEAEAVHRLGLIHMQRRELDQARALFDESLELDAQGGQRVFFQGEYERHVGFVDLMSGDTEAAIPHFERSLAFRRQAGAIDASMFAAASLASALVDLGRPEEAKTHILYALTVAARIDSPVGKARNGLVLGRLYGLEGDIQAARLAFEVALKAAESVGYLSVANAAKEAIIRLEMSEAD